MQPAICLILYWTLLPAESHWTLNFRRSAGPFPVWTSLSDFWLWAAWHLKQRNASKSTSECTSCTFFNRKKVSSLTVTPTLSLSSWSAASSPATQLQLFFSWELSIVQLSTFDFTIAIVAFTFTPVILVILSSFVSLYHCNHSLCNFPKINFLSF